MTSKRSMPRNRSRLFNQSTGEGDSLQNAINAFQVGHGVTYALVAVLILSCGAACSPPGCAVWAPWSSLISVGMAGLCAEELRAASAKRPQHSPASRVP